MERIQKHQKTTCLTVSGVAGSGKSTFIKTLITTLRKMFNRKPSAEVCAPTGSAAFSAGGSTCHRFLNLPINTFNYELTEGRLKQLRDKLHSTVCLIIDERSLLSSANLALAELHVKHAAYNGRNKNKLWGGIPLVILVGDDFQLPSIDPGMLSVCDKYFKADKLVATGNTHFKKFAENVMVLNAGSKRQHKNQTKLLELLAKTRCENLQNQLTSQDIDYLLQYDISRTSNFTDKERQELTDKEDTLFLFANKEPRDIFNAKRLKQEHSETNPVAIIRTQTRNKFGRFTTTSKHFKDSTFPIITKICRNAKVQLAGKNFRPEWGLFNGSIGKVKEIIYAKGKSPNSGDMPEFILVDFPNYKGPEFIPNHPTYVPIPAHTAECNYHCCKTTYIPLELCYAKTIHTFQGQNAGPVSQNQAPNAIGRIICDPGTKRFEGQNPGLLYTILSRATTLGEDKMSSAVYFTGNNATKARFQNITQGIHGTTYKKVILRERWMAVLKKGIRQDNMTVKEQQQLIKWSQKYKSKK